LLLWVIPLFSSIWVLFDAKSIGVRKGQIPGFFGMGVWGWFFACLILYLVAFPGYLVKRGELRRVNGKEPSSASVSAACWAVYCIVLCAAGFNLYDYQKDFEQRSLQEGVEASVRKRLSEMPGLPEAEVDILVLVHKTGN